MDIQAKLERTIGRFGLYCRTEQRPNQIQNRGPDDLADWYCSYVEQKRICKIDTEVPCPRPRQHHL